MSLIRQLIGIIFLIAILILAWDVLFNIFGGIIPNSLKSAIQPLSSFMDTWSTQISYPIVFILNFIVSFMPDFIKKLYPITNTGILGAKIAWIPFFALIVYSNILRIIDEWFFTKRMNDITPSQNDN